MTLREKLVYGAVVAVVAFLLGQFVFKAGTVRINFVFAIAMGIFAMVAVTVATRMGGGGKK